MVDKSLSQDFCSPSLNALGLPPVLGSMTLVILHGNRVCIQDLKLYKALQVMSIYVKSYSNDHLGSSSEGTFFVEEI